MRQAYDYWQDQPGCITCLTALTPRTRRRRGVGVRMCSVERTMKRGRIQRPFRNAAHTHLQPAPGPLWGAGWYSLPSEEGRQQAETVPNGYGYALQGAEAAGPEHECAGAHCRSVRARSVHREGTVDFARTFLLNNCEHPGAAFAVLCGFTYIAKKNVSQARRDANKRRHPPPCLPERDFDQAQPL